MYTHIGASFGVASLYSQISMHPQDSKFSNPCVIALLDGNFPNNSEEGGSNGPILLRCASRISGHLGCSTYDRKAIWIYMGYVIYDDTWLKGVFLWFELIVHIIFLVFMILNDFIWLYVIVWSHNMWLCILTPYNSLPVVPHMAVAEVSE